MTFSAPRLGLIAIVAVIGLVASGCTTTSDRDPATKTPPSPTRTHAAKPTSTPTPHRSPSPTPSSSTAPPTGDDNAGGGGRPPVAAPPAPPAPPAAPPPAPPAPPAPAPSTCSDVIGCVNVFRAENGRPAFSSNATLNASAQACADRMASTGVFEHSTSAPAGFNLWGENIAYIFGGDARRAVELWKGSTMGHREAMLRTDYTQAGAGVAYSGGLSWWCLQFGG